MPAPSRFRLNLPAIRSVCVFEHSDTRRKKNRQPYKLPNRLIEAGESYGNNIGKNQTALTATGNDSGSNSSFPSSAWERRVWKLRFPKRNGSTSSRDRQGAVFSESDR